MRQIDIEDSTFNELAKWTTPLKGETADTVITKLLKLAKKNGHAPGAPAKGTGKFITRKSNPDKLNKFYRQKFIDANGVPLKYWQAAQAVFIASANRRLSLLSIVKEIFNFPNTPEKEDRTDRAVRSLSVALRGYGGGPAKDLFQETENEVFELRKK